MKIFIVYKEKTTKIGRILNEDFITIKIGDNQRKQIEKDIR